VRGEEEVLVELHRRFALAAACVLVVVVGTSIVGG
jgi:hypothetical protein